MKILGIETSCDETCAAVVEDGTKVLSNVISSQIDIHAKTGGVVPEIAAREHVSKIIPVIEEALNLANCTWDEIDAIATTKGPGLIGCLIVGTTTANTLAKIKNKPLISINHVLGHIYSNFLEIKEEPKFPLVILTVSGGHNNLVLMSDYGDFKVIGETIDDAAGEAFDKVARMLGLPYPGGPEISKVAKNGNRSKFNFPRATLNKDSFDFSFSGLKTSVLYKIEELKKENSDLTPIQIGDLAASFEEAVCDILSKKLIKVANKFGAKEIHLSGGVSANNRLREIVRERWVGVLRFPSNLKYCTDNAAMIGAAGYFKYKENKNKIEFSKNIEACANLMLDLN